MNTANKLTLCRVVMIPIFIVLLYLEFAGHLWVALAVFILASVTDFVDGYVARHYDQVTDFGKFMDPLADKLLVMSAMVWFVEVGWMPAWAFFILLCTPTRKVEEFAEKILARGIHTVDSFDIHTQIAGLRNRLDNICKKHDTVAITAAGWDPGSDSIVRALMQAAAPKGITYTNFGPGMSMHFYSDFLQ